MQNGLIFDLDGTLVDSLSGIAGSLNRALQATGLPTHSNARIRGFVGNGARMLVTRAAPPDADHRLIDQLENAFKADYDVTWESGTFTYTGIAELMKILQARGHPLAVLSNKPHPFTTAIVERLFPEITFRVVLGQLPGIPHKPDPTGALEIANLLGLLPADCTIIGDSTMDLETAHNAGMRAIAVTWGFHDYPRLLESGAKLLANDPAELLTLI